MNIKNIKIDSKETLSNALLVEARQYATYKDGKKSDTIEGSYFSIVLPNMGYEKISIKIKNIFVEDKDIKLGKDIFFSNPKLSLYQNYVTKEINITGEAEGFSQVKNFSQ